MEEKAKKTKSKKETKELELQNKIDEINDKYLRLHAEFDNFRRRVLKEKLELSKFASEEIITSLLPILDDFNRAEKVMKDTRDIEAFNEGIMLIINKLKTLLEQKGLKEMEIKGESFNTDFHEAITNIPAPSEELKGKIIDEIEKGYLLNGKVIRFAKVVVGS